MISLASSESRSTRELILNGQGSALALWRGGDNAITGSLFSVHDLTTNRHLVGLAGIATQRPVYVARIDDHRSFASRSCTSKPSLKLLLEIETHVYALQKRR